MPRTANTLNRRRPLAQAAAGRSTPKPATEGIITAIVAVTGDVDEVQDCIIPGAFKATLIEKRPKVCFGHQWLDPVGRILHIEELMPGDPRLPKKQPNGFPWPRECGALLATMQFNMRSERGREVFEIARFYAESGEAAWSIGYKVVPGKATKRGEVRYIYALDLYEVSLVLHGAHSMTMALEVKSAAAAVATARVGVETKTATRGGNVTVTEGSDRLRAGMQAKDARHVLLEAKAANGQLVAAGLAVKAADTGRVLMLQRALDPDDPAGGTWEFPGGHIEDGEDPFAAAVREWQEETGTVLPHGHVTGTWDSPNGVYRGFVYVVPGEPLVGINKGDGRRVVNPDDPDGDKAEVAAWWNIGALPDLTSLREEAKDTPWEVLATAAPPTETAPPATPEDDMESKHADGRPDGLEAKYDTSPMGEPGNKENWVDQTGGLPPFIRAVAHALERERGFSEEHAIATAVNKMKDWAAGGDNVTPKTIAKAAKNLAQWEAMKARANADNAVEGKAAAAVTEARSPADDLVETKSAHAMAGSFEEVRDLLRPAVEDLLRPTGKPEKDRHADEGGCWVTIEATYPDHVIVSRYDDGRPTSYAITYSVQGEEVTLGTPEEVELEVVATASRSEEPDAAVSRYIDPATGALTEAGQLLVVSGVEGKALEEAIRPSLVTFLDGLAAKGVDVPAVIFGDEEEDDSLDAEDMDSEDLSDDEDLEEKDVHTRTAGGLGDDENVPALGEKEETGGSLDDDEDRVYLDQQEVKDALESLRDAA